MLLNLITASYPRRPLATPSGEKPIHKDGLAVLKDGHID